MTLVFDEETKESVSIDLDKWHEKMLPLLKKTGVFFKYDADSSIPLEDFSPRMTEPCLLGVLFEIYNTEEIKDIDPDFYNEISSALDGELLYDDYGNLKINTKQAGFVNAHEEEVSAWLPLVVKKHIKPHARCVKDFLRGSI